MSTPDASQNETKKKRIVFCGVGALGSTAMVLCRNLDCELVAVDFDRVESKNLLAQAFTKPSLGKNKAEAMKLQIANFWGTKIESFGVRVSKENVEALTKNADVVVDCFDNAESRRVLSELARAHRDTFELALLHAAISADGTFGIVRWDETFVPDSEDSPGQPTCEGGEHLPMIGLVAAALARTIQDYLKNRVKRDSMVSLASIIVTGETATKSEK